MLINRIHLDLSAESSIYKLQDQLSFFESSVKILIINSLKDLTFHGRIGLEEKH